MTKGIVSVDNGRRIMFEGVKGVHPSSRLSMFVGEDVGNLSLWVFSDPAASRTCKAISHRVV